jgi:DeoR/GlpR family transcriptional regulator of sugar metabolism
LVQRPAALRDVLATLLAEFDVNEATCRADLLAFVTELVQKGLVTRVRDGA